MGRGFIQICDGGLTLLKFQVNSDGLTHMSAAARQKDLTHTCGKGGGYINFWGYVTVLWYHTNEKLWVGCATIIPNQCTGITLLWDQIFVKYPQKFI